MKKMFRGIVLIGAVAGAAVLLKNALSGERTTEGAVQITLSDGSLKSLSTKDIDGQEFADIARKLVESGV